MSKKRKPYTKEELAAVAKGYDSLLEFRAKEPRVYDAICSRKLLDELCGHMKRSQRKDYTDEELIEVTKGYDDLTLFIKEQKRAYLAIQRRGKIDEMCGHMKRDVTERTEEELAAIAKGYDDLKLFRKEQSAAYAAMQRKGLIDKLCGHMKRHTRPDYTDEELTEIANKYNNLTLFKKEQRYPYSAIQRRGKLEEMCGHMKRSIARDYTEEEIRSIALKYKTKEEFRKKGGGAYLAAYRRGILDNICGHMEELRRPKGFYSKGYCHVVALEYKTIGEFRQGNGYAYSRAWKEGWLDDICNHMKVEDKWNKRLVYAYTFPDGYAYVGLTDDVKRRKNEHLHKYTHKKISPVLRHSRETGLNYEYKELTDWLDAATAAKVEDGYIKKYKAEGWKMLNRMRGGGLGGNVKKEHKAKAIRTIVSRYEYVEDFRGSESEVYRELCDNRQFSKYCSGLKRRKKQRGYWTLERAASVMQECNTTTEFRNTYRQAYRIVKEAGLLDGYYPKVVRKKYKKWTLENCATAARYCEAKSEFRRKHRRAYERLRKEGLLDELFDDKEIGRH